MTFSALAQGDELSYQWYKAESVEASPVIIAGANDFSYYISRATVEDSGLYYLEVSNSVGKCTTTPQLIR